jgi:hypothetical protein
VDGEDGKWEFHETDSYGWLCIFDGRTTNRKTENIDFWRVPRTVCGQKKREDDQQANST